MIMANLINTTIAMWDVGDNHFSGGYGAVDVAVQHATV